jgi:hypothetical protein
LTFATYLASAPANEFFWWSAVPGLAAAAGFIATFVFVRRTRIIEDMPTSRLRAAAQGYVEVEGIARLMEGPPILCPLTVTKCVWWRYKVEQKQTDTDSRGNRRTSWRTLASETSSDCFLLDDGTGRCVIDPDGADVLPTVSQTWYGYAAHPDVGPAQGRGLWRALWCTYRYTEQLIHLANPVYVLGAFRTQGGVADAFDTQADLRELLDKWKHDKRMMALLDVNKDGTVDMKEWAAARRMAQAQVEREQVERAVVTPDLNVLGKPRDGRPFILSGIPQAALIRRYRTWAMACLGGMTLAAGFLLWTLRARGAL